MINTNLPEVFAQIGEDMKELRNISNPQNELLLFTGQSNMQRTMPYTWDVPSNLYVFDNVHNDPDSIGTGFEQPVGNRMSVPFSVAAERARTNPNKKIYVLVCAIGGQPIASWLPGGPNDIFGAISNNLPLALSEAGLSRVSRIFWWQGESGGFQDTYGEDFEKVANRFETLSGIDDATPWTIFGVTPTSRGGEDRYDITNLWLQKIVQSKPAQRKFVPTYALSSNAFWDDNVHLSALGYDRIGTLVNTDVYNHQFGSSSFTQSVRDANALALYTGKFTVESTTANIPLQSAGTLEHTEYNPNFSTQVYIQSTTGIEFQRRKQAGVWGSWLCTRAIISARVSADVSIADLGVVPFEAVSGSTNLMPGPYLYPRAGYWSTSAAVRLVGGVPSTLTAQLYDYAAGSVLASYDVSGSRSVKVSYTGLFTGNEQIGVRLSYGSGGPYTVQSYNPVTHFSAHAV